MTKIHCSNKIHYRFTSWGNGVWEGTDIFHLNKYLWLKKISEERMSYFINYADTTSNLLGKNVQLLSYAIYKDKSLKD